MKGAPTRGLGSVTRVPGQSEDSGGEEITWAQTGNATSPSRRGIVRETSDIAGAREKRGEREVAS